MAVSRDYATARSEGATGAMSARAALAECLAVFAVCSVITHRTLIKRHSDVQNIKMNAKIYMCTVIVIVITFKILVNKNSNSNYCWLQNRASLAEI